MNSDIPEEHAATPPPRLKLSLAQRLLWPFAQLGHAFKLTGTHLLHHVIGATLIASLMLALEGLHVLEWLDAAMLRFSAEHGELVRERKDQGARYRPGIIEIDQPAFEQVFQEREPLERARLEQLIASAAERGSKVLAIDLDLAPAVHEEQHEGGRPLDRLLDKLATDGHQLVLILPEESPRNANLPWIRARCEAGVHFASPQIRERMGAVTRIELKSPVLAAVTFELAHGVHEQEHKQPLPGILSEQKEVVGLANRVCQLAKRTGSEKELARWAFEPVIHGDAKDAKEQNAVTAPFHPSAMAAEFLDPTRTRARLIDGKAAVSPDALRKNVVYIGTSYDPRDRYTTAEGEQSSLHLHAAAHASLGIGTADVNKYVVFAADIVIGVLLGCLFGGLWTLYGRAELAIDKRMEEPDIGRLHRMGTLAEFYGIRVILCVVWASPVLIGLLAIYLSHGALEQGWWVNPGPLIAGMFLHAMSLRDEAHHPHEEVPGLNVWAQLRRTHPGIVLVQAPLAVLLFIVAVL
ncbi:CHASE2 domain-containing protein [Janthinobacterium aquaticum]|uniref:CHASE2 domain-containing protein n=1 Tax=Janthinobacterium sp. FT58W TaxID=2654254 RepID=UPI001265A205|nr:CHASE2 domain-containing protein [Janthinobacterium sp. FT58W]KAB8045211.1 CHASE2 domain-containing protein [Janthinobacterium sp. FT58W]